MWEIRVEKVIEVEDGLGGEDVWRCGDVEMWR